MQDTYRAAEVYEPGKLRLVERKVSEPGADQVRIRVEACGICHTDAATVMGVYPGLPCHAFLDMKWLVALKPWAAECPNGESVKGLVSVSLPERTELVNRAVEETS